MIISVFDIVFSIIFISVVLILIVVPIIVPIEVILPAVIIICGISVYYCRIYFSPVNCRIPFFGVIIVSVIDAFLMIPSLEFLAFQQVYRRERKSDTSSVLSIGLCLSCLIPPERCMRIIQI